MVLPNKISASDFLAPFFDALDTFTLSPNWRIRTVLVCFFCVALFQFPDYKSLYASVVTHSEHSDAYENFVRQTAHPLQPQPTGPGSHESNMVFRITLPILAHVLHLNIFGVLALQLLGGLVMLWALLTLIERITQDRPTALLLVVGTCFTYFGSAFLHDVFFYFDAFGYAVLILLLLSRRPLVIYALSVAGCFLDERVLAASLLVVLWHSLRAPAEAVPTLRRPTVSWAGGAAVAGWLTYGGLRLGLASAYHLQTDIGVVGLEALKVTLIRKYAALGFITGLESFWGLLVLALLLLLARRQWALAVALLAAFGPVFVGAFLVFDITRSLAYGFPVVLLALVVLAHYFTRRSLRHVALVVAAFAVLIPNYAYHLHVSYSESLMEKVTRLLLTPG